MPVYSFIVVPPGSRNHNPPPNYVAHSLVVEQPDVLLNERDTQLFCCLEDRAIVLTSSRGCDVFGATPVRPEDVVNEGEERI